MLAFWVYICYNVKKVKVELEMTLNDMLKIVFSEWYQHEDESKKKSAYKNANNSFHKLLDKYGLNDEDHLNKFKANDQMGAYDFSEKDVQLFQFIREIDAINPNDRINASYSKQTLKNFTEAAYLIKTAVKNPKYSKINHMIEASLRTQEFLSIQSISNLVVKLVQIFQYACECKYTDFNVYDQLNEYLDTLLYTYLGVENCKDIILNECMTKSKVPIFYAHEYNSKLEFKPISVYNGFNPYVKKVFENVTNENIDSYAIDADTDVKFRHDYRYEFNDIEDLKKFLTEYYKYRSKSEQFRNEYFFKMESAYLAVADCVNAFLKGKIIFLYEVSEEQKLIFSKECLDLFSKILEEISIFLKNDNDCDVIDLEVLNDLLMFQNVMKNYALDYGNPDFIRLWLNLEHLDKIIEYFYINTKFSISTLNVCKFMFLDSILNNIIDENENGELVKFIINMQISYKHFPISLNMLSEYSDATGLADNVVVQHIVEALQKTDKQIKEDLSYNDKLYDSIDNAVGIYLSELFEKAIINEAKKKNK